MEPQSCAVCWIFVTPEFSTPLSLKRWMFNEQINYGRIGDLLLRGHVSHGLMSSPADVYMCTLTADVLPLEPSSSSRTWSYRRGICPSSSSSWWPASSPQPSLLAPVSACCLKSPFQGSPSPIKPSRNNKKAQWDTVPANTSASFLLLSAVQIWSHTSHPRVQTFTDYALDHEQTSRFRIFTPLKCFFIPCWIRSLIPNAV